MTATHTNDLPNDITALKALVLAQLDTLEKKQSRIHFLEEQIILFRQRQFGKSSEKSDRQTELFDEAECEADLIAPDIVEPIEHPVESAPSTKYPQGESRCLAHYPAYALNTTCRSMTRRVNAVAGKFALAKTSVNSSILFRQWYKFLFMPDKSTPAKPVITAFKPPHYPNSRLPRAMPAPVCSPT